MKKLLVALPGPRLRFHFNRQCREGKKKEMTEEQKTLQKEMLAKYERQQGRQTRQGRTRQNQRRRQGKDAKSRPDSQEKGGVSQVIQL